MGPLAPPGAGQHAPGSPQQQVAGANTGHPVVWAREQQQAVVAGVGGGGGAARRPRRRRRQPTAAAAGGRGRRTRCAAQPSPGGRAPARARRRRRPPARSRAAQTRTRRARTAETRPRRRGGRGWRPADGGGRAWRRRAARAWSMCGGGKCGLVFRVAGRGRTGFGRVFFSARAPCGWPRPPHPRHPPVSAHALTQWFLACTATRPPPATRRARPRRRCPGRP